ITTWIKSNTWLNQYTTDFAYVGNLYPELGSIWHSLNTAKQHKGGQVCADVRSVCPNEHKYPLTLENVNIISLNADAATGDLDSSSGIPKIQ
ncbi:hypothetical protein D5Q56_16935, partial [Vibrio parahaemolyticus]|nr:hypothetical protein [Vibrio parahaemolyticus]